MLDLGLPLSWSLIALGRVAFCLLRFNRFGLGTVRILWLGRAWKHWQYTFRIPVKVPISIRGVTGGTSRPGKMEQSGSC